MDDAVRRIGRGLGKTLEAVEEMQEKVEALTRVVSALVDKADLTDGLDADATAQLEFDLDEIRQPLGSVDHLRSMMASIYD